MEQARAFEVTISPCKFVLFFDCPETVLEARLLNRGKTSGRADDNIETIKKRFATFVGTSYAVVTEYERIGKCARISSVPPADEVYYEASAYFVQPSTEKKTATPKSHASGTPETQKNSQASSSTPETSEKPGTEASIIEGRLSVGQSGTPVKPASPLFPDAVASVGASKPPTASNEKRATQERSHTPK